jgi:Mitochondrial carrier protein
MLKNNQSMATMATLMLVACLLMSLPSALSFNPSSASFHAVSSLTLLPPQSSSTARHAARVSTEESLMTTEASSTNNDKDLIPVNQHAADTHNNLDDSILDSPLSRRALFISTAVLAASPLMLSATPANADSTTNQRSTLDPSSSLLTADATATATTTTDWSTIIQKAGRKALGGGKAGAAAAVVQVCTLMWLRTSMNYQYRYGGTLQSSLDTLWKEGGIQRLYQGLPLALVQGPLTRFGDTAANVGILAILQTLPETRDWPLSLMTAAGSATAGLWRIVLMPIDSSKTVLQVEGQAGLERLWGSVLEQGPGPLYRGALAQAAATAAGHFPWFVTYNSLNEALPTVSGETDLLLSLGRSALLGFAASGVSDCVSNSLRVIKTTKQTAQAGSDGKDLSYPEIVNMIIKQDGVLGLFGRGLQTRLLTNAIQGAAFSVLWRYFQQMGGQ